MITLNEEIFVNNKIDYVIHSAAIKFMNFTDTIKLLETNVIGTMNLVKLSKKYSVKNFMEKIVNHYNFSVYQGVNFLWSDGSVLDIWSDQIKKKEKLNITNFEQSRHYCHVTTVCKDLIENLDNKNNTLIPSNIFEIKLIDLFLNFIKFFDYDKNKTNIFGDRKDEKLSEELLQSEYYTIESNFDIYKKLKFTYENEDINSFFEARNIYWDIDKQIIRSMLKKTFESLNSRDFNTFAVASLSENIEEDIKFACSLYEGVVSHSKEFDSYINDFVKNWELDRISRMDLSIIRLGIAEMTSFSYIPVKVTINECIDLAKISALKRGKVCKWSFRCNFIKFVKERSN